jgi:cytidylate kinase
MKLPISSNILKYYLRNVYFITGHSYAGKSTMVRMLAERYDMVECGENYHGDAFPESEWSRWQQPAMWYNPGKVAWEAWLGMTPEEHWLWIQQANVECTEIEVLECVRRAASGKKVIVDTNIPPDVLREISDYSHVAIMTSDPETATKRFFDRDDWEKKLMQEQIEQCKDPEATRANFDAWFTYKPPVDIDWEHTGFFTYKRTDYETDTREEMLAILAGHFGLTNEKG